VKKKSVLPDTLENAARHIIDVSCNLASENLRWVLKEMRPYFSITLQEDPDAIASLALGLQKLKSDQRLVLSESAKRLLVARHSHPGSLYETLRTIQNRAISYAQFSQSDTPIPEMSSRLEVQKFEFDRKDHKVISEYSKSTVPSEIRKQIKEAMKEYYPSFDFGCLDDLLKLIWANNEGYVRISPAKRVAQLIWLYYQSTQHGTIFFNVEETEDDNQQQEYRIMFATGIPPQLDFIEQVMEVFNRLGIEVNRAYCLIISNGVFPYFLGTFYVQKEKGDTEINHQQSFDRLKTELYNTQIISTSSDCYNEFVEREIMTGAEASLVEAFISFCHTNLSHSQPDRFNLAEVKRTFISHPEIAKDLLRLFSVRFDPGVEDRDSAYRATYDEVFGIIENYNTGRRHLDRVRKTVFHTALSFISNTLKTNYYVAEKTALVFRVNPSYLNELDDEFTADLPADRPFRITFFHGRHGIGYHIGFSDIARGGWRTVLAHGWDDYVNNANTLFRENYVLAHTQHLKNKDIYEGGSKMVALLDAADIKDVSIVTRRLYKLQYGFTNAFLDIFVTEDGQAKNPQVVDYYLDDEPIELGPDENMHDSMVEWVASQSVAREYVLGIGIMSSKEIGINHKEFGVTSAGVVKFAEIAMAELGIDMHRDAFSVKLTGGPNGDVAGNAMRLLLERCPQVGIRAVVDGSGALYDPVGADSVALGNIVLKDDVEAFDPASLHEGGFILYRNVRRTEGLRELYKKVICTPDGLEEKWITVDEFNREFNSLIFTVEADLFIPAGGRPETIDSTNWQRFFLENGESSSRVIVEGANSFITPEARVELQKKNVIILRDASANKCGVISSSYEIIANLLMTEKEFLINKTNYVDDVLEILEKRAEEEAKLIFLRHQEPGNTASYTDISASISDEINTHYARLFDYFQKNPKLSEDPIFQKAVYSHLPKLLRSKSKYRQRIKNLPIKYLYAIQASEIASSLVYRCDRDADFEEMLKGHLVRTFSNLDK